ncbi:MAG: DUF6498-containing protein [Betaproteobacteria bacterium]
MIPVTSLLWGRLPATALIAANLVVAAVTLIRGWGFYEIIIVYWCEAMIIGGYNMARMVMVGLAGEPLGKIIDAGNLPTRLFLLVIALGFFAAKFGGFALATGLLVAAVPAFLGQAHDAGAREIWHGLRAVAGGVAIAVIVLFISHGISFVMNYLVRREYENTNLLVLMFWPYVRMSLVVTALAAGLVAAKLIPALDTSTAFGVVIVLVKMAADLLLHQIEHAWLARKTAAP